MSVLDGGRDEGTHKRILGPLAETHETQRLQVKCNPIFNLSFCPLPNLT